MNIWHDIDPAEITPEKFTGVIEIPKGSKCKYGYLPPGQNSVYSDALSRKLRLYPAHLCGRRRPSGRAGAL